MRARRRVLATASTQVAVSSDRNRPSADKRRPLTSGSSDIGPFDFYRTSASDGVEEGQANHFRIAQKLECYSSVVRVGTKPARGISNDRGRNQATRSTASGMTSGRAGSRIRSSVIEQITYLLFIKRLDELQTVEERKATMLKEPLERRIFPEGRDGEAMTMRKLEAGPTRTSAGRGSRDLKRRRCSRSSTSMSFPFIREAVGGEGDVGKHMKEARFAIPTPALLAKVVDKLDAVKMDDRDTKGDVYEYMLGKIASAGQNGQFRTPRHIIELMVELTEPTPGDIDLRSRVRHLRLPRRGRRVSCAKSIPKSCAIRSCARTSTTRRSTASISTRRCCASAR